MSVLGSGRTHPLVLECEINDPNEARGTFVVKAPGLPEVDDYGLFAESLGYLLAQELEIETPRPATVTIGKDFADATNESLRSYNLSIRPGTAFGSEHLGPGLVSASVQGYLNSDQQEQALNIFCFDLLIQNPDRLPTNPNCLVKNGRFVAFDFNVAFSFLMLIGRADEPWEFSKHQIASSHLFYKLLKGKELDFKPFIKKVSALTPERLDELVASIPFGDGRWDTKIEEHIMSIVDNTERLEIELARCLA